MGDALQEADASYLAPLLQWHASQLLQLHQGTEYPAPALVSSFDLGRLDFPLASAVAANWTVLSLNGAADWLQSSDLYAVPEQTLPPGPCEETGEWRQMLAGLDWRPQDTTVP